MKYQPFLFLMMFSLCSAVFAQPTSEFTYQGGLKDGANAANGNYDFEFRLYDAVSSGNQVGTTVTKTNVPVAGGTFAVRVDFGDVLWNGMDRYIEIRVRNSVGGSYTLLSPREKVGSSPYAIKSVFANQAQFASTADNSNLLGGFGINSLVFTNDFRLSDSRTPTAGSPHYIQNNAGGQSVEINANGTIHSTTIWGETVRATNQYNIGTARVFHITGNQNVFVGAGSGAANASGSLNSFYGSQSGNANTSGSFNSFFGGDTGNANIIGNHNSFFGARAGFKTTSSFNAFFGSGAGVENTSGHSNSFVGYLAGSNNSTGFENSFFGRNSGIATTSGQNNSFFGAYSGSGNTNGVSNSFFGASSGSTNTSGDFNSFFGYLAGNGNNTGNENAFFGASAGQGSTAGTKNAFFGRSAGVGNLSGSNNSFFGYRAGAANGSSPDNSFFGYQAGAANNGKGENSFFGAYAGENNTSATHNTFVGYFAGRAVTQGESNTMIGHNTGSSTTTGLHNTFVGKGAGTANTVGGNNTLIGFNAEVGSNNLTYATAIGSGSVVDESNKIVIGRSTDNTYVPGRLLIEVPTNQTSGNEICYLGGPGFPKFFAMCSSSRKYKHDFADYKGGLSYVNRLRPVTFKWNNTNDLDLGLVAEEVAEIDPLLAVYKDGEVEGVKYRQMTVVLINAVKEQQAQIEELKSANQELKSAVCGLIPSFAVCGLREKGEIVCGTGCFYFWS